MSRFFLLIPFVLVGALALAQQKAMTPDPKGPRPIQSAYRETLHGVANTISLS